MLRSFGYGPFWSRPIMLKQRASPGWGSLKLLQEAGLSKRWRYTADFSLLVVVVNKDFVQTKQLQVEKSQGNLGQAGEVQWFDAGGITLQGWWGLGQSRSRSGRRCCIRVEGRQQQWTCCCITVAVAACRVAAVVVAATVAVAATAPVALDILQ